MRTKINQKMVPAHFIAKKIKKWFIQIKSIFIKLQKK
jgi:hypothetical protein